MDPRNPYALFSLVFGLILGSFLNVCIHRIPRKESIVRPPSSCPRCGTPIRFYDNIPLLSFILLRGRCRFCGASISIRYPLVETTTGLLSLALFLRYGVSPQYVLWLAFCASLLVITFIDLDHMIIPEVISLPGIVVGLGVSLLPFSSVSFLESILGAAAGWCSLQLVRYTFFWLTKKEGMGGADPELLAMIGAWLGWRSLASVILIAALVGTLVGGGSLLLMRRNLRTVPIPFGPFLSLGALAFLFFRKEIYALWFAYMRLLQ